MFLSTNDKKAATTMVRTMLKAPLAAEIVARIEAGPVTERQGQLRDFPVDALFGRPLSEWAELDHILKANNMTPMYAAEKLRGYRGAEGDVEVFDSKNQDRLLGTMLGVKKQFPNPQGNRIEYQVALPMSAHYHPRDIYKASISAETRVSFEFGWKADGWDRKAHLITSTPLKLLLQLDKFRLPGETHAAASERRYHSQR